MTDMPTIETADLAYTGNPDDLPVTGGPADPGPGYSDVPPGAIVGIGPEMGTVFALDPTSLGQIQAYSDRILASIDPNDPVIDSSDPVVAVLDRVVTLMNRLTTNFNGDTSFVSGNEAASNILNYFETEATQLLYAIGSGGVPPERLIEFALSMDQFEDFFYPPPEPSPEPSPGPSPGPVPGIGDDGVLPPPTPGAQGVPAFTEEQIMQLGEFSDAAVGIENIGLNLQGDVLNDSLDGILAIFEAAGSGGGGTVDGGTDPSQFARIDDIYEPGGIYVEQPDTPGVGAVEGLDWNFDLDAAMDGIDETIGGIETQLFQTRDPETHESLEDTLANSSAQELASSDDPLIAMIGRLKLDKQDLLSLNSLQPESRQIHLDGIGEDVMGEMTRVAGWIANMPGGQPGTTVSDVLRTPGEVLTDGPELGFANMLAAGFEAMEAITGTPWSEQLPPPTEFAVDRLDAGDLAGRAMVTVDGTRTRVPVAVHDDDPMPTLGTAADDEFGAGQRVRIDLDPGAVGFEIGVQDLYWDEAEVAEVRYFAADGTLLGEGTLEGSEDGAAEMGAPPVSGGIEIAYVTIEASNPTGDAGSDFSVEFVAMVIERPADPEPPITTPGETPIEGGDGGGIDFDFAEFGAQIIGYLDVINGAFEGTDIGDAQMAELREDIGTVAGALVQYGTAEPGTVSFDDIAALLPMAQDIAQSIAAIEPASLLEDTPLGDAFGEAYAAAGDLSALILEASLGERPTS